MNYLEKRLAEINVSPERIKVRAHHVQGECWWSLFRQVANGIEIAYVNWDGNICEYESGGKLVPYTRLRWANDKIPKGAGKYKTPPKAGTRFFFPPAMIRRRDACPTLVITEGEFKALAASENGIPCIAVSGIHNTRVRDEYGAADLPAEFVAFIKAHFVRNIVFLFDADALGVEYKDENHDMRYRPNMFYTAIRNFREGCKKLEGVDVYMGVQKKHAGAKGLDDLIVALPDQTAQIVDATLKLGDSEFFYVRNVSDQSLTELKSFFHIKSAYQFFEKNAEQIKDQIFTFGGSKYQYVVDHENEKKTGLKCILAEESKDYLRVGTEYFKIVEEPLAHVPGFFERKTRPWMKGTILDDYRQKYRNILHMIQKYDGYANIPSYTDYKQTIGNFFNHFQPPIVEPAEGEWPYTEQLIKHIFGEQYEMGLDYIQILYQRPTEALPILCLVSAENNTGKTTFGDALRQWFGANVTMLNCADLDSQFNDFYATKHIAYVDETFIDKLETKERVKNLSTAKRITINAKGVKRYEVDCFIKIILISNNEDTFLKMDCEDMRFWVRKIPKIKSEVVDIVNKIREEAPAFLYALSQRTLSHPKKVSRMWFPLDLIRTDAFEKAVQGSKSTLAKLIEEMIHDMFIVLKKHEIKLTAKDIFDYLRHHGIMIYASPIIQKVLKNELKMTPSERTERYDLPIQYINNIKKDEYGGTESKTGKVYTFKITDFVHEKDIAEHVNKGAETVYMDPVHGTPF